MPRAALNIDPTAALRIRMVGLDVDGVKAVARYHTARPGGRGAVREFAEALLKARGDWQMLLDRYRTERETAPVEVAHGA